MNKSAKVVLGRVLINRPALSTFGQTGQLPCSGYLCTVYQMHDDGFCWKDVLDAHGNLLSAEKQNILVCANNGQGGITT